MTGIGEVLILVYTSAGLAITGALFFALRKRRWKWAVVAPLVLVVATLAAAPFAEEAHIASHFAALCKDAGVHVGRKVLAAGFYDGIMRSGFLYIDRSGYEFMEHPSSDRKKVEHVEKIDGKWVTTVLDRPSARYHLLESQPNRKAGYRIVVTERVVVDSQNGEVIARDTTYKRYANSVDQSWAGALGSTLTFCPDPAKRSPEPGLADRTISPLKRAQ